MRIINYFKSIRFKTLPIYAQVPFVWLAFAAMAFASYLYMSDIENKHLERNSGDLLTITSEHIYSDLIEPRALLNVFSQTLYRMILDGADGDALYTYFNEISNYAVSGGQYTGGNRAAFGYFDVLGGRMFDSAGRVPLSDDAVKASEWYKAAVAADGGIGVTKPIIDKGTHTVSIIFARCLYDGDGNRLAIICIEIPNDGINGYVTNTRLTEGGYGVLYDAEKNIIAHPDRSVIGLNLSETGGGIYNLLTEMDAEPDIKERTENYRGEKIIATFHRLDNGWFLGIMTPLNQYSRSIWSIAAILGAIGGVMATALSFVLIRISAARNAVIKMMRETESELSYKSAMLGTVLDSMPDILFCKDREHRFTLCNKSMEEAFGVKRGDIIGKSDAIFNFDSQKTGEIIETDSRVMNGGQGFQFEEWVPLPDGRTVLWETRKLPLIQDGKVVGVMGIARDITEQRANEARVREADERVQLMFNTMPLCSNFRTRESGIIDCNAEAVRLFGFSSKEEYISHFYDLYPEYQPDGSLSSEKAEEYLNRGFDEGYCRFEWLYQKPDGEPVPCEVTFVRVKHRDEYVLATYVRDLREQKTLLKKLEVRDALLEYNLLRYKLTTDALDVALWHIDIVNGDAKHPDNKYSWSQECRAMLGFTDTNDLPDTLAGWTDLLHPGDKERTLAHFNAHISDRTGRTPYDMEYRIMAKTGEYRHVHAFGSTMRGKDGEPLITAGGITDVTERLMYQKKLREADERVQLMFDTMPLCAVLRTTDNVIIDCNKEVMRLFDFLDKEDYIRHFYDLYPTYQPDGRLSAEKAREVIQIGITKGYYRFEWLYQKLDGQPVPCEVTLVRAKYREDYVITTYIRDLREEKAMTDKIQYALEAAEEASVAKSAFLANMSHEIRTPMNSIIGFSELALDGEASKKTRGYLTKIIENSKWLLQIINDILDISKIESNKLEMENIPFDLHELFSQCQDLIMPRVLEKGIQIYFYAEPSIGRQIMGDPTRIRQVLINLLTNSVKFTNNGIVKMAATVKHACETSCTIYFEVRDSGIGMTQEQIDKVLEPFIQADVSTTRRYGGTGLGLPICKRIIELMGGTLAVESTPGIGSKFSFELTFDITDISEDVISRISVSSELEKPSFSGEILLCEDNRMNQEMMVDHLSRVGLKTVLARNGREGVDIIAERVKTEEKPFDLIFMDIHMPVMDGLEAADRIRALGCKTPIVALTANIMLNDREMYRQSGMLDCLGKPFTSQELWHCLLKYFKPLQWKKTAPKEDDAEAESMLNKLNRNFLIDNRDKWDELKQALDMDDIRAAHRMAHTLKSNAALIGKTDLREAAAELETALKNGENHSTGAQLSRLSAELASVIAELQSLVTEPAPEAHPLTDKEMTAFFDELERLLKHRNPECVRLADMARGIPGAEKLVEHIEFYRFRQAIEELAEVRKLWAGGHDI